MTILEQTATTTESGSAPEASARVTRPTLERDAPIRNWTTLFGPAWGATVAAAAATPASAGAAPGGPVLGGPVLGGPVLGGPVLGGPALGGIANAANAMLGAASQTLTDAVGQGYRVINEYLAQGQRQAEALRFPDWSSFLPNAGGFAPAGGAAGMAGLSPELQQQLFRRFMQYGMDFASLWFEMLSRTGWPAPPGGSPGGTPAAWTEAFSRAYSPAAWAAAVSPGGGAAGGGVASGGAGGTAASSASSPGSGAPAVPPLWPFAMPFPWAAAAPPGASSGLASAEGPSASHTSATGPAAASGAAASDGPERVFVAVSSERRVESVLELRRGSWSALAAHALRPEGHDAPAICGVTIEARPEDSLLRVSVEVPATQAPGVYNGMIVDTGSNLPRGTLTVRVLGAAGAE